jgi:anti-sigma factor RsiW
MRRAFANHPGKLRQAAYVTGTIGPADRAALVRHLESCERCRDEVAGLAALPGLLRRLPAPGGRAAPG